MRAWTVRAGRGLVIICAKAGPAILYKLVQGTAFFHPPPYFSLSESLAFTLLEHVLRPFTLLVLLLPLVEIAGMVLVGERIGVFGVLSLLILDVLVGLSLMRWQGLETL